MNAVSTGPPAMIALAIPISPDADWTSPAKVHLSFAKSECSPPAALASHLDGPIGELCCGQPGAPSAGYGSLPWGPWWWQ